MAVSTGPTPKPAPAKRRLWTIVVLALTAGIASLGIVLLIWPKKSDKNRLDDDPRLTYSTPYRNVRPEVKYVGDQACADCHPSQAETFHRHPMGRSFLPLSRIAAEEHYGPETNNPFTRFGFLFHASQRQGKVYHRQTRQDSLGHVITEHEDEVHFVLGSGNQGRAYLINRDGYLFQSPISWFSQKEIWDLSPGFTEVRLSGRPIQVTCLFCHSNQAHAVKDTENRYQAPIFDGYSIGCERCHGPGELHVRLRQRGDWVEDFDATIINPSRLSPPLREAVCQQCHLLGLERFLRRGREAFDFRPGLPLHLFYAIFVSPPGTHDTDVDVGQVDQMYQSRCFRASDGRLGCISCHDPHALPSANDRVAFYRARCLKCHQENSCGLSPATRREKSRPDSCIDCHMPRSPIAQIAHTANTDHRIIRKPAAPPTDSPLPRGSAKAFLVNFYQDLLDPGDEEAERDLGFALSAFRAKSPLRRRTAAELALPRLEKALHDHADDIAAWEAKAQVLDQLGRKGAALAAIETAVQMAPNRERTLRAAAALAESRGQDQTAITYWQRLIDVNPWRSSYHLSLAELLARQGDWQSAAEECLTVLAQEPANVDNRLLLVQCYLQTGQPAQARAELEMVLRLAPDHADDLRRRFHPLLK